MIDWTGDLDPLKKPSRKEQDLASRHPHHLPSSRARDGTGDNNLDLVHRRDLVRRSKIPISVMIVAKSHLSLCRWVAHAIYKQAIQIKSGQVNGVLKQGVTGVTAFG